MRLIRICKQVVLFSIGVIVLNGCETTSPTYQSNYPSKRIKYVETENIQRNLATEEKQELADEI